jgi:glucose-1-phosphate adenylyltransferase
MGNYLFGPQLLMEALRDANRRGLHDLGHHVLPVLSRSHRCYAYDFAANRVPGIQPYEDRGYWRDVGTIEAYREAQTDVAGPRPRFQLSNPQWPIRGQRASSPGIRNAASSGREMSRTRSFSSDPASAQLGR